MATNGNDGLQPTDEIINKYRENLDKEVATSESNKEAKEKERDTQDKIENYKICLYVKANETSTIYENLKFYVSEGSSNEAGLIKTKVTEIKQKNTALSGLVNTTVANIKNIRTAMNGAADIACRLERSKEEEKRCHPDIYNALQNGIPTIWDTLEAIKNMTNENFDQISAVFDCAVDVSGIQTFANLDSLTEFCDKLVTATGVLKQDVEGNITSSADKKKAVATQLVEVQKGISQIRYAASGIISTLDAKTGVQDYLDANVPECQEADPAAKIKESCQKIMEEEEEVAAATPGQVQRASRGASNPGT